MFGSRYFGNRYYPGRYFGHVGAAAPVGVDSGGVVAMFITDDEED
jgi:hypothetical protein